MAIEFNDRSSRKSVKLGGAYRGDSSEAEALKAKINTLRAGLINEGIPSEKKVHKHADSAINYIDTAHGALGQDVGPGMLGYQTDMEAAHGHIDKLADIAYYDGAPEHRDLGEDIQEHISKLY